MMYDDEGHKLLYKNRGYAYLSWKACKRIIKITHTPKIQLIHFTNYIDRVVLPLRFQYFLVYACGTDIFELSFMVEC